jgi:alkylhydroperoxidase family enzyme
VKDGTWRELDDLDEAERLALEYAERMTSTPPTVDEHLLARLREHFSQPAIVEMAAIVAWENYRARLNTAIGVEGHGFYSQDR